MTRTLTPGTSLESLKKEAKARLKELGARQDGHPSLRDVQHAIAREFGATGWNELVARIDALRAGGDDRAKLIDTFFRAAGTGNVASVTEILDAHPDLINVRANLEGHDGKRCALHFAVAHELVVRLLLERGANPNIRDDGDNAYPLHFVAENQNLAIIKLLVEHGADPIGTGDVHELEVLGWATAWDYVEVKQDIVDYLLAHGARHNIFSATAVGDAAAVREVVGRSRTDLDQPMDRTNHRRRPLHLAVIKRQPQVLAALLDLGATLDVEDAAGLTPLDQAALRNEQAMASMLIDRGAAIRLPAAIALQRIDVVDALVRAEPNALKPGGRWHRLIVRAAERSPAHVIETLLRFGASVNAFDDPSTAIDGAARFTPLHAAASTNNVEAATVLLKYGANRSIREGRWVGTAAGWARFFHRDAVRDLILAGPIDIFEALDFDLVDRLPEIVRRDPDALHRPFREYADLAPRSDQWWPPADATPLAWARQKDRKEAVRVLLELGAVR